jgi:hypothetical protein
MRLAPSRADVDARGTRSADDRIDALSLFGLLRPSSVFALLWPESRIGIERHEILGLLYVRGPLRIVARRDCIERSSSAPKAMSSLRLRSRASIAGRPR